MVGTIINFLAIIIGSILGMLFGARLSEELKKTVIAGMGLFTAAVGLQMFLKTEHALVVLGALVTGAILGEWWGVEEGIQRLGILLEKSLTGSSDGNSSKFVRGFLTASVLFSIGPMAVMGAISDGLRGDHLTLSIKSVLDGIASIAFASTLGVGVAFSSLPVFAFQGTISLLAAQFNAILSASMISEMTATGGVILVGIAMSSLLEIKKMRVGNFLPALFIAPAIVYVLNLFTK